MTTLLKKITLLTGLSFGLVSLTPALALAQTGVNTTIGVSASTTVKLGATETRAKERGTQEIDRRVKALTELNVRVQAMQKVTPEFKQSISTAVQNQITAFGNLKTKIEADTDVATLKTDIQSVNQSYRVFALVLPQARIAAAADRIVTIAEMMSIFGSKLQARVQAASQAGNNTTEVTAALTSMGTNISDAQTKAQAAVTASASLSPDEGDKTKMANNDKVLKQARADITAALKDLQDARKDATTIIQGLAKFSTSASSTSTVTP